LADRFRLSSALLRRLQELGIRSEDIVRRAGLPAGLFQQEKVFLSTEELFAFYRGVAGASGDPAIGLKLGTEERLELYDPVCIAALCARSFRDALERIARYKQLVCPEEIRIAERRDECAVQFVWLFAGDKEPTLLTDLCFAWTVAIGQRGTGLAINPRRIELLRPEAHRAMYQTHFRCSVEFGARQNVLVFDRADVARPFVTYNADLLAAVAPQLEAELSVRRARNPLSEQVKRILKRLLAGQRPGLEAVAEELRVSTRTLQRRLTAEGVSFQRLMEDARRELARHYLSQASLELNETAYLLGYEDANSFFRAFHQWEGTSPGEWRAVHARSGRPARATASVI
jgi:AraC-like DNA-binding protein